MILHTSYPLIISSQIKNVCIRRNYRVVKLRDISLPLSLLSFLRGAVMVEGECEPVDGDERWECLEGK